MSKPPKEMYAVPDWMRPHLALFQNTGGNDVEELLHDEDTSMFANSIRYMLIVSARSQFALLVDMHSKGLIADGQACPSIKLPDERFCYGESEYDDGFVNGWNAHGIETKRVLESAGISIKGE